MLTRVRVSQRYTCPPYTCLLILLTCHQIVSPLSSQFHCIALHLKLELLLTECQSLKITQSIFITFSTKFERGIMVSPQISGRLFGSKSAALSISEQISKTHCFFYIAHTSLRDVDVPFRGDLPIIFF